MTIDQKLEILKRAMEMGADVKINFHSGGREVSTEAITNNFPELKFKKGNHEGAHWLDGGNDEFEMTIFMKKSELAELEKVEV